MLLFSPIVRAFDHICMEKARYKFLIIIIIISYFPGCNDLASTSLITAEDINFVIWFMKKKMSIL